MIKKIQTKRAATVPNSTPLQEKERENMSPK